MKLINTEYNKFRIQYFKHITYMHTFIYIYGKIYIT
jgi:hypothetical protein